MAGIEARSALLLLGLAFAGGARAEPLPDREWRVGVFEAPPYAMKSADGRWRGLTVDLWTEIAADLGLKYRFEEGSRDSIVDGIARGRLDTAAAPFARTVEREQILDFSHTYFTDGLGMAVRHVGPEQRLLHAIESLVTSAAGHILVGLAVLALLFGALVWLIERRKNPEFGGPGWKGPGAGAWWASVTASGVGYGDKVPRTLPGRLVAVAWMVVGLVLYTLLTASLTATLAVSQLNEVRGLPNLRASRVGTIEGSAAADFLRRENIRHRLYTTLGKATRALEDREVEALVYAQATLRYFVERDPRRGIEIVGGALEVEHLAFPLTDASPLRDPIDRTLRRILVEPHWRDQKDRYLLTEDSSLP